LRFSCFGWKFNAIAVVVVVEDEEEEEEEEEEEIGSIVT
jgi:hypothetical protein